MGKIKNEGSKVKHFLPIIRYSFFIIRFFPAPPPLDTRQF